MKSIGIKVDGQEQVINTIHCCNGLVESKKVTSDDGWQCVFENLALYDDQNQPMNYYITEDYIEGYITDYEDYDIINTKVESKPNVPDTIISYIIKT